MMFQEITAMYVDSDGTQKIINYVLCTHQIGKNICTISCLSYATNIRPIFTVLNAINVSRCQYLCEKI